MVITDEMKKEEINKSDLIPISFLKLSPYTGSKRGIRFRLEKFNTGENKPGDPAKEPVLRCFVWRKNTAFAFVSKEELDFKDFEFNDGGIDEAIRFLNEKALSK